MKNKEALEMQSWGVEGTQGDGLWTRAMAKAVRRWGAFAAETVIQFSWCEGHLKERKGEKSTVTIGGSHVQGIHQAMEFGSRGRLLSRRVACSQPCFHN